MSMTVNHSFPSSTSGPDVPGANLPAPRHHPGRDQNLLSLLEFLSCAHSLTSLVRRPTSHRSSSWRFSPAWGYRGWIPHSAHPSLSPSYLPCGFLLGLHPTGLGLLEFMASSATLLSALLPRSRGNDEKAGRELELKRSLWRRAQGWEGNPW